MKPAQSPIAGRARQPRAGLPLSCARRTRVRLADAVLAAVLLAAGLLAAGCTPETPPPPPAGSATPTRPAASATPQPTAPATAEPAETIDLTAEDIAGLSIEIWHPWDGALEALLQDMIAEFNAGNEYGLEVSAVRVVDQHEAVARALAAGNPPDLAFGFSYHALAWSQIGPVADWSLYLGDPQWGLAVEELADFQPAFLAAANTGAQTGLPFYRTVEVLLYNTTWAGELGFSTPPATPEDLSAQACAANAALRLDADPANDGEGGLLLGYEPLPLAAWMYAFGGAPDALTEAERYAFDRPENIAAFQFLRGLLDEHCAWLPEGVYPHDEFALRRGLFLPSTLAGLAPQAEAMAAAGSADAWMPIPYPVAGTGRAPLFSGPDLVLVSPAPEGRLAGWVFARWLLEAENQARWSAETGYVPVRISALASAALPDGAAWISQGAMLTPPASWVDVQWAVSEMSRMLFSPFTPIEDIPALAAELDLFADEFP